jgi:hypothetical protein
LEAGPIQDYSGADEARRPEELQGMVGFGYSKVLMVNRGASPAEAELSLRFFEKQTRIERTVPAGRSSKIELKRERSVDGGPQTGDLSSDESLGIIVRTDWPEGGSAFAYSAQPLGRDLIVPIVAKNVYSMTSNIYVRNASSKSKANKIELTMFDAQGSIQKMMTLRLDPGQVSEYDFAFDVQFDDLPVNAGDGHITSIRVEAEEPVALLTYFDELSGVGTAAYGARPRTSGAAQQHLPLVRANYMGGTLIAVANAEKSKALEVSVTYRGATDSPTGAGQTFEQSFSIAARSHAFIDLSSRGRSGLSAPAGMRGSGRNGGFYGSAIIEANGAALVTAVESLHDGTLARSSAAYKAFGPADLGTAFALPDVQVPATGAKTHLVLLNPQSSAADINVTYLDGAGAESAGPQFSLAAGETRIVALGAEGAGKQANIASNQAIAVLGYDSALVATSDWGKWGHDTVVGWAVPMPGGDVVPTTGPPVSPTPTIEPPTATPTPGPGDTPTPSDTAGPPTPHGPEIFLPAAYRSAPAR